MRQLDEFCSRRLSRLSTPKQPSLHRHRWSLMHFNCHKSGKYGTHCERMAGVRAMEEQRSLNVRNVDRNSVGHRATHHPTKIHRKDDGKETEKETARENPERWKGVNHGKGKGRGKKGQRLNEITEPPEEQWTGGTILKHRSRHCELA